MEKTYTQEQVEQLLAEQIRKTANEAASAAGTAVPDQKTFVEVMTSIKNNTYTVVEH